MSWMFFLFGLVSLTGQILLLREVLVIFHGTEISIGIFFGTWLAGIGIGASTGARLVRSGMRDPVRIFLHSLPALGFSLLFQIVLIRLIPRIFGASPAELAPLHGILVAVPVGTFSTSFLTGFLFPMGCHAMKQAEGRTIGRMYALEALGGLIGGILFTFFMVRWLSPLQIAAALSLLLSVGVLVLGHRKGVTGTVLSAGSLLLVGAVICSPIGARLTDATVRVRWEALHPGLTLLASTPTPYQQIEIAQLGNQRSLFGNGKIVTSFPDPHTADRLAALVAAQNPEAKQVLLVGGGIGSLVKAVLQYPILRLDVVEPDPWALEIAKSHMPREETDALDDPRVHVIIGDGRFYVNRLEQGRYDAVVCLVPDPVSSFWNRYYTEEFFQAVSKALAPGGVFVIAATSAENFWGSEVASYAGSVYHTLKGVFPEVMGSPGDVTLFFSSITPGAVSLDPHVLKTRYETMGTAVFDPTAFRTLLPPERTRFVKKELERSPVLTNTDLAPLSTSLALILWGRFSGSAHMEFLNTIRRAGIKVYLIPLAFFFLARVCFRLRWGPRSGSEVRFQVLLAMATVAGAAMGIQIILMYSYQSLFGYVFERIGLIAATFMAGLVVGALGTGQVLSRIRRKHEAIAGTLVVFALFCLTCPTLLKHAAGMPPWRIEIAVFVMVLVSGLLTGIAFPLVAARHLETSGSAGESSGWTDALDHYGAALGAVVTGTLLVPLLGIEKASMILALALVVPSVLMLLESPLSKIDPVLEKLRPRESTSFPYTRLSWILVFSVIAAFTWHLWAGPPGKPPIVQFPEQTLKAISGSELFEFKQTPFPHYRGTSPGDTGFTLTLSTIPPAGDIRGYGGPINLLISVSNRGVIQGASVVESRETPSYVRDIEEWLQNFKGLSIPAPLEQHVDTVTGATITSKAVIRTIAKTGRMIGGPLLDLEIPDSHSDPRLLGRPNIGDPRLWAVICLMVFFVVSFYSRSRPMRYACLFASMGILGFWLNAPFTSLDAASLLTGEIPAQGTLWRNVLLGAVALISLLWGQAFCGYLCPFGALQEIVSVKRWRLRASQDLETTGRYIKYVVLAVLLCLFLITNDSVWFGFSPLQHFFGNHSMNFFLGRLDVWILALCVAVLIASTVYFRFWCRYLCPAGACLALTNKIALLRQFSPRPVPGLCDLGVRRTNDVDCIRCLRCLHTTEADNRHGRQARL
ncbi:MAG: fused MFS/spermidine synthase [Desulfomonilaceae bacterium]|nr:fused MFS/spermidine synthase [Desulfomonilaceae bacterium]